MKEELLLQEIRDAITQAKRVSADEAGFVLNVFNAEVATLKEQLAALAEQNERVRKALANANAILPCEMYREALALPDIATPALNRIKADGLKEAEELCKQQGAEWDSGAVVADKNYAAYCATLIGTRITALLSAAG